MPPKVLEELEASSAPEGSDVSVLAGDGSGTDSLLGIQAAQQVSVSALRRKPRKNSVIWPLLTTAVVCFGPLCITWLLIGDKLGLPDFRETIGAVQKTPAKVAPVVRKDDRAQLVSVDLDGESTVDTPKLLSPSVQILDGQFIVDQLLDRQTSKPIGIKTMVDVQLKNLTRCEIIDMAFELKCTKSNGETEAFNIDRVSFASGFMSEESGVLSLTCEPGVWEKVEVSIVSVESENESELTVIGPYLIQNGDRLVEN